MTRRKIIFLDRETHDLYMTDEFNGDKYEFEYFHKPTHGDCCNMNWEDILHNYFTNIKTLENFKVANSNAQREYVSFLDDPDVNKKHINSISKVEDITKLKSQDEIYYIQNEKTILISGYVMEQFKKDIEWFLTYNLVISQEDLEIAWIFDRDVGELCGLEYLKVKYPHNELIQDFIDANIKYVNLEYSDEKLTYEEVDAISKKYQGVRKGFHLTYYSNNIIDDYEKGILEDKYKDRIEDIKEIYIKEHKKMFLKEIGHNTEEEIEEENL